MEEKHNESDPQRSDSLYLCVAHWAHKGGCGYSTNAMVASE